MKILVVEDHDLFRQSLIGCLLELKGQAATVIEACDSRQAMIEIEQNLDLELVLLDLNLPDRDGLEMLTALVERYPTLSVVVVSVHQDRDRVMKAFDLGVLGFVPKSTKRDVMLKAFSLIFSGGRYVPPEILDRRKQDAATPERRQAPVNQQLALSDLGLTVRQMDVLELMMQGKSNKAICRALNLAETTVKIHVSAILRALKAANRTEAVIAAGALGIGPRAQAY